VAGKTTKKELLDEGLDGGKRDEGDKWDSFDDET